MCSSCAGKGLTGLPEAIAVTWPHATIQTCVVHLICSSMRFVAYTDRKQVAAALKPIYTTNAIESLNDQPRKITQEPGTLPQRCCRGQAAVVSDHEHRRQANPPNKLAVPRGQPRTAPGKLVEGQTVTGWKAALAELAIIYPDRFNPYP